MVEQSRTPRILNLGARWRCWSVSIPGRFTPRK